MNDPFARAGEPVTTEDGKVICYVKNDLYRHTLPRARDFHEFQEGEAPWVEHTRTDDRCVREKPNGGLQICINGEWRP